MSEVKGDFSNALRARKRRVFFETRSRTGKETMRAAKPEITANTAVCDGALGSIPEAAIKYA